MLIVCQNDRFGDPFKIQWAPKWDPRSTKWCQVVKKSMIVSAGGSFYSLPTFIGTMVITVPFGPSGFRMAFLGWRLSHFLFLLFLCVLFVIQHLYRFFHNTTVNVKPLSPPIFKKIAPHFKKLVCSYFGSTFQL